MSCPLKTILLTACLSAGLVLPAKAFAQQDSTATEDSYEAYEDEEYVTATEEDTEDQHPLQFSEISTLPFKDRDITTQQWQALTRDKAFVYEEEQTEVRKQDSSGKGFDENTRSDL